jgi:hypothetical protein
MVLQRYFKFSTPSRIPHSFIDTLYYYYFPSSRVPHLWDLVFKFGTRDGAAVEAGKRVRKCAVTLRDVFLWIIVGFVWSATHRNFLCPRRGSEIR